MIRARMAQLAALLLLPASTIAGTLPSGSISYTKAALLDFVPWDTLPGSQYILDQLTFNSFSGYIDIDKATGKKFSYWFFESQQNPKKDPVMLWTNGGPGCR